MATFQSAILQFTDAAIAHIKKLMAKQPTACGFRLSVKKTGCSGWMYVPGFITEKNQQDIYFLAQQDLPIFVDAQYVNMLKGTTVDLVDKGLGQQQLVFYNPNAEAACGCGESFNIKDHK